MLRHKQHSRHRADEKRQHDDEKGRRGPDRDERGSVDRLGILLRLVGKTEEARLHAVIENHEEDSRHCVEDGHYAVFSRREKMHVKRHKEPVEETPQDAAHAVDGRVLGQ